MLSVSGQDGKRYLSFRFTLSVLPSFPHSLPCSVASIPFRPYGAKGEGEKYVTGWVRIFVVWTAGQAFCINQYKKWV